MRSSRPPGAPESIEDLDVAERLVLDVDDDASVAARRRRRGRPRRARSTTPASASRADRADPARRRAGDHGDELPRCRAHGPGGPAADARARPRRDRERHVGRRSRRGAARWLLRGDEVRGRGPERGAALRGRPLRDPGRARRARRVRDRVPGQGVRVRGPGCPTTSSRPSGNAARAVLGGESPPGPEAVAAAIADAIESDEPRLRWPVGADAEMVLAVRSSSTDEEFEATMRGTLGIEW